MQIAEKVCKHLPEGWEVNLCMENGAAWVKVFNQDGTFEKFIDGADQSLETQLNIALNIANGFST